MCLDAAAVLLVVVGMCVVCVYGVLVGLLVCAYGVLRRACSTVCVCLVVVAVCAYCVLAVRVNICEGSCQASICYMLLHKLIPTSHMIDSRRRIK